MDQNELDSTCGVSDDELTKRFIEAVRIENEIKKQRELQFPATTQQQIPLTCFMQMEQKICASKLRNQKLLNIFTGRTRTGAKRKSCSLQG